MTGGGMLSTKNISLDGVTVIQNVADILQKPSLKNTRVKDLKIEFSIKDGRVSTKPFDIKLDDYKITLSGTTGLDQTIDYRGEIVIPESFGKVSQIGTVDMLICGTFTSPKVKIDLESLAKNAAKSAAKEAAKNAVGKLLGVDTDDNDENGSESSSGNLVDDIKKEVTKGLLNKAKSLFK
jgi:hypothetical protein